MVPIICITLFSLYNGEATTEVDRFWPQWRGPRATGVSPLGNPPTHWSDAQNIRWKVPISGRGHASPVIWSDTLFLMTATEIPHSGPETLPAPKTEREAQLRKWQTASQNRVKYSLLALDRHTGKQKWIRVAREQRPHESTHLDGSWASGSAVTDGKNTVAFFGSAGVYCYTMNGDLVWNRDLGDMDTRNGWGEGSSPLLYKDKLVINWDHEGDSFIVVLNLDNGETIWKKSRNEVTSWATPIVVNQEEVPVVVVNGTNRIRGYDLTNGRVVWEVGGMTVNAIPSPVTDGHMLYVTSGYRGSNLLAIDLTKARGDLAQTDAVRWQYQRDTPYVPSPLLYQNRLYFFKKNRATLSCLDAETGAVQFGPQRLEGLRGVYASPVAARGKVYLVGRDGNALVLEATPDFKILAKNNLDDQFDASPAIVDTELYLRGHQFLYCISEKNPSRNP